MPMNRQAASAWAHRARGKRCVICGAARPRGHHIVYQQILRREHPDRYEDIRWDYRNLLPLCDRHHAMHHSRAKAIPLSIVLVAQPKVVQFARELDLVWWLSRTYPKREWPPRTDPKPAGTPRSS